MDFVVPIAIFLILLALVSAALILALVLVLPASIAAALWRFLASRRAARREAAAARLSAARMPPTLPNRITSPQVSQAPPPPAEALERVPAPPEPPARPSPSGPAPSIPRAVPLAGTADRPPPTLARSEPPPTAPTSRTTTPPTPTRPPADRPQTARPSGTAVARWVSPGEVIEVADIRIGGGMIYVGRELPCRGRPGPENCLINPALPVSRTEADRAGGSMSYWPSYSTIPPAARRAYLEWLANGRTDPEIGIGHVFLFFYGLERRLLVDGARDEADGIVTEIRRLLAVYGGNGSFRNYAGKLLDVAALDSLQTGRRPDISAELRNGYELPITVRLYLGQRLASGAMLDAEDSLLWLVASPDGYLRTAATRCFDEFRALWGLRFRQRYPSGLAVRAPNTPIELIYRAASGTFSATIDLDGGAIPDVAALSAPLETLRDLALACTDELDPYSRLLGRRPEARDTLEAALLLPKDLLETVGADGIKAVCQRLSSLFDGRDLPSLAILDLLDILAIEQPPTGRITSAVAARIGAMLDRLDIGFEPDRRYGPAGLVVDGKIVLFQAPDGAPVDGDQSPYLAARTMVEINVLAALADGSVDAAERDALETELTAIPELSDAERMRLMAYFAALQNDVPGQRSVLSRLAKLPDQDKRQVTQSAVGAVLADGRSTDGEVKFLERLYHTLGLPKEEVYLALHRGGINIDEPVKIAAEELAPGIPIPLEAAPAGIRIDAARLERIRTETSEVSSLLAGIFIEEPVPPPPAPAPIAGTAPFRGLDVPHGELLLVLLEVPQMDRSAFEDSARLRRLLPDGAIETINEWGFGAFDEPVVEGDDIIFVAEQLRPALRTMKAAA